jgi:hypothetical protein
VTAALGLDSQRGPAPNGASRSNPKPKKGKSQMAPSTMTTAVHDPSKPYDDAGPDGFDVTCVIGQVVFSEVGSMHPEGAAFLLIGEHGTQGVFTFPREDGSVCRVDVTHVETVESALHSLREQQQTEAPVH